MPRGRYEPGYTQNNMSKVIKNPSLTNIEASFRGRPIILKAKRSLRTPDGEEGDAMARYLLETWGFLQDKTPQVKHLVGVARKAKGVRVVK